MRLTILGLVALLAYPAISIAAPNIVAMDGMEIPTVNASLVVALGSDGRLWIADDCSTPWRLIDTIPGAVAFDWWDSLGAIATSGGELLFGQLYSVLGPFVVAHTVPMPVANVVDVGLFPQGPFRAWIRTASNELWTVVMVGDQPRWSGPCQGPVTPVAIAPESFGKIKAQHR